MADLLYASIKTFNKNDSIALFDHLCKNVCLKPVEEVKDIMEIKKDPDIIDVVNLIKLYDMKVELKVYYVDSSVKTDSPAEAAMKKAKEEGVVPEPSERHKAILDQQKDITNDQLKDVNKIVSLADTVKKEPKKKIDPGQIPEF